MDNEISLLKRSFPLKRLNQLNSQKSIIFWKPSDEDIQRGFPKIEAHAKLSLDGQIHGFLLNGRFYYPKRAKIWALKNQLSINYLLNLTEVTLESSM